MDLVSASVEKLEALPRLPGVKNEEILAEGGDKLEKWLEDMKERTERIGGGEAQFTLGQYYFSCEMYQKAFEYFKRSAEGVEGLGQAKFQLGVMCYDGLGVKADLAQGLSYMLEVANSTKKKDSHLVPSAQYNIGRAYFMGFGMPQSDSEAEKWWILAGSHGKDPSSVRAQSTLGMFYSRSETFDNHKMFHWTQLAAGNGHLESMAALGLLCMRGNDGDLEGLQWLKRSSEGGCVYGTGLLAHLYLIKKLYSKAAETAFKVSELDKSDDGTTPLSPLDRRGVAIGCFVLARCLQLGLAVTKNEEKAHHYYTKATSLDKPVVAELHNLLTHGKI